MVDIMVMSLPDLPSLDDMSDMIGSVTRTDDEFIALCYASTEWPANLTSEEFLDRCHEWMDRTVLA